MRTIIALTAFSLSGCHLPTAADNPAIVTNLRFSPSAFDSFRSNTELRYTLATPAELSIMIVRKMDGVALVKTIAQNIYETKGTHGHTWLGDTGAGRFAPAGEYVAILSVGGRRFESSVEIFHY